MDINSVFRAENSNTTRHLSEFWMLEAEISHVNNVDQVTTFTEDMIKFVPNHWLKVVIVLSLAILVLVMVMIT